MRNKPLLKTMICSMTVVPALLLFCATVIAGQENWKLIRDEAGIQVYQRPLPHSAIREFLGVTTLNTSLDSVAALMNDYDACRQWVYRCDSASILQQSGFRDRYIHQISDFPFPALNRELILHALIVQSPSSESIRIIMTATPDFCTDNPLPACSDTGLPDHVLIRVSRGSYLLEPLEPDRTRVNWQQHVEPGGQVPDWMANSMLREIPFRTLKKLRRLVRQPRYQSAQLLRDREGGIIGIIPDQAAGPSEVQP